jgi:tRNA(fMet)-specific endonuclease VapC
LSQSYVLDTSALLHLIRGKEVGEQIAKAFGLRESMHRHVISIVTHGELYALAGRRNWGHTQRAVLKSALENLVTVNVDRHVLVEAYVRVEEACRIAPGGAQKMGHNDLWIAATTLLTGLPLITTDKDFNHLNQRLILVHWVDPQLRDKNQQ